MKQSILLVGADPAEMQRLRAELLPCSPDWEVACVMDSATAFDKVIGTNCTIVIADGDLPAAGTLDLLEKIREIAPKTLRFLRAANASQETMLKCVWGSHRFLPKLDDAANIQSAILSALELEHWLENPQLKTLVSSLRTFPTIPSVFNRVVRELNSPNASIPVIAEIIAGDLAITTKILQAVNSPFYGLHRRISDLTEGIGLLGLTHVKDIVLAVQAYGQMDHVKPIYFSVDRVWKHGISVGAIARKIALYESDDLALAEEAFTAGLLHDLGKLILACNLDQQYYGLCDLARKQGIPLCTAEKELFGATHADVGAYLLAIWGLPAGIVDAVGYHHSPGRNPAGRFTAATAVHVANVLAHQLWPDPKRYEPPTLDLAHLESLGLGGRPELWQRLLELDPKAVDQPAQSVGVRTTPAPQPVAKRPAERQNLDPIVVVAAAGCLLLLLLLLL